MSSYKNQNRGNHLLTIREYYEKNIAKLRRIKFINYNLSIHLGSSENYS